MVASSLRNMSPVAPPPSRACASNLTYFRFLSPSVNWYVPLVDCAAAAPKATRTSANVNEIRLIIRYSFLIGVNLRGQELVQRVPSPFSVDGVFYGCRVFAVR